jgi:hypothetical protein
VSEAPTPAFVLVPELLRIPLPKLSEKGYEQRYDRAFGGYKEAKTPLLNSL